MRLTLYYTSPQEEIFFKSNARMKIIPKGRRFGLTRGFAHYLIDICLDSKIKALWVDTSYSNITKYIERYFAPNLAYLPRNIWNYNAATKEMKIGSSLIDFRSADLPENIEGFGYHLIVINEAGIVLKDESLWYNSILPMSLDYHAKMLIGGTPKGKRNKRLKKPSLFYELSETAKTKKDWQLFNYTTYDNPLISKEDIDELVKDTPYAVRQQEIFAKFVDDITSNIIKAEWWQKYSFNDLPSGIKIDSWDTAFKKHEENDYSVRTSWVYNNRGLFLYDYWKEKVEFPNLKKAVIDSYQKNKPDIILIEDKASGISLIQELKSLPIPIKAIKVDKDKIARANAASPFIESGNVFIIDKPFANEVIQICEDFPEGAEDDTVDSITQAINYVKLNIDLSPSDILVKKKKSMVEFY